MSYAAKNISFEIHGTKLLRDVSLSVKPGCLTAVLGANGAGKSTLLKIFSGEIKKYNGQVHVNGENLQTINELTLAKTRAVLSQNIQMEFSYTVLDVVMLGGYVFNSGEKNMRDLALSKLRSIGMGPMQNRIFLTLSGGEQQKAHLARVLMQISNPTLYTKYLFLDEPTAALDIAHQHLILGKVKQVCHREKIGVMAILHDLNLAAQYADKFLFLKKGKTVAYGTSAEVFTQPIIEETFNYPVTVERHNTTGIPMVVSSVYNHAYQKEPLKTTHYDTIYS